MIKIKSKMKMKNSLQHVDRTNFVLKSKAVNDVGSERTDKKINDKNAGKEKVSKIDVSADLDKNDKSVLKEIPVKTVGERTSGLSADVDKKGKSLEKMVNMEQMNEALADKLVESRVDIQVTVAQSDSSLEDEEIKVIFSSCDEADDQSICDMSTYKKSKSLKKPKRYEQICPARKRSKSVDNGRPPLHRHFDFSKFGISVGCGIPQDLLPGIEDYLCNVLANEKLSDYAEEQRQYFLERLDIIKLPPSVPPRPQSLGVSLCPVQCSPPASNRDSIRSVDHEDFAAYQRELSRALIGSQTSLNREEIEVKVYDDIDITDSSISEIKPETAEEEESMYEIPQLHRTPNDSSGYEKAPELSPLSKSVSSEEQPSSPGKLLSGSKQDVYKPSLSLPSGPPPPPPLPPRGDRASSDAANRGSIGSLLEDKILYLPTQKLPLNRESSMPVGLERNLDSRSEKSSDDLLNGEEYDKMSCKSLEGIGSLTPKSDLHIKLPRPVKRKHMNHQRKLGKSLSSLWEITQPYSMLEDMVMSGELHYKSKLAWTKKIVALTNGRLVCYKADKTDSRPSFVILLLGYRATFHKRENKQNFEICLDHDNLESHTFLVPFKDWAETWCEHINAASKGLRAPGPMVHLARGSLLGRLEGNMTGSSQHLSSSTSSLASSDGLDDPGTVKVKKRDPTGTKTAKMGAFAYRATQFFESLGKKGPAKKPSSIGPDVTPTSERDRTRLPSWPQPSAGVTSDKLSPNTLSSGVSSERLSPLTPGSDIVESPLQSPEEVKKHIKHQGYLDVFSSFNKRKWGKRWCLIHENNFECYRTQTSEVCELEILLKKCVLRRAIEETKSELGLMLMENNRERITIEPRSWNDLGSWLRILMQETSTPKTPEGLEGYMDDTHPYHEAVEITRLAESSKPQVSEGTLKTSRPDERVSRKGSSNRDSGICSSTDERSGSLERNLEPPTVHPCFNDSSLPRVSVGHSGAIYTQVRKTSETSLTSPLRLSSVENKQSKETPADQIKCSRDINDDSLFFDFETESIGESTLNRNESLVDEIMTQLKYQHDNHSERLELETEELQCTDTLKVSCKSPGSFEFDLSPIKSEDAVVTCDKPDVFCSTFVEEDSAKINLSNRIDTGKEKLVEKLANKDKDDEKSAVGVRRHTSGVRNERKLADQNTLQELRTRLVQLKKDRISIRDRKQKSASETDRQFLEAEYDRLDRECRKVSEEIKTIEIPESPENVFENGDADFTDAEINSTASHSKDVELKECKISLQTNKGNRVNECDHTNNVECDSNDTSVIKMVTDDKEARGVHTDTGKTEGSVNTELDSECIVCDSKSGDSSSRKTNTEIANDVNKIKTDNLAEHKDIVEPHSGEKTEL